MRKQINSAQKSSNSSSSPKNTNPLLTDSKTHQGSSNNSSSSSKTANGKSKNQYSQAMQLKMAHPAVILHQELHRQAVQQQAKPRKRTALNTNQSSSLSHSEGKSSSSNSGNAENQSSANTPSKQNGSKIPQRKSAIIDKPIYGGAGQMSVPTQGGYTTGSIVQISLTSPYKQPQLIISTSPKPPNLQSLQLNAVALHSPIESQNPYKPLGPSSPKGQIKQGIQKSLKTGLQGSSKPTKPLMTNHSPPSMLTSQQFMAANAQRNAMEISQTLSQNANENKSRLKQKVSGPSPAGPPTIVFNLESKVSRQSFGGRSDAQQEVPTPKSQGSQQHHTNQQNEVYQAPQKTLGYRSFIQMAAHNQYISEKGPQKEGVADDDKKVSGVAVAIHMDYLNKTLDQSDTKQIVQQSAPANYIPQAKSPAGNIPRIGGIKPAISPPGEKIVIKKSEIKFSTSPSNSPQPTSSLIGSGKISPTGGIPAQIVPKKVIQAQQPTKSSILGVGGKKPENGMENQNVKQHYTEALPLQGRREDEKPAKLSIQKQGKEQAFDFIKRMLNEPLNCTNEKKPSPKKDQAQAAQMSIQGGSGPIKLSLSGQTSPYSLSSQHPKPRHQKSSINFVQEMKKHGIDKDIASVKAMRQILASNSPQQSVSPSILIPYLKQTGQQYESRDKAVKNSELSKDRSLKIKTSFKVDDVNIEIGLTKQASGGDLGNRKSPQNQFTDNGFTLYKRSRSLSPPKDDLPLGNFTNDLEYAQADIKVYMGSGPMPKYCNESAFPKANQRAQHTLVQQKSVNRINTAFRGGPVIPPNRESMENVIKAAIGTQSPGNIFYSQAQQQTNLYSFSNKKQPKDQNVKAQTQRARQEQEEIERRILAGTEVEEWLGSPQRLSIVGEHEPNQPHYTEETKIQHSLIPPPPQRTAPTYHFSKLGFIGDTDDLEEDDIEKDMAGNDDWMFQTFQKNGVKGSESNTKNSGPKENALAPITDENLHDISHPSPESIRIISAVASNLANSFELEANFNQRLNDAGSQQSDENQHESDIEDDNDEGAIPNENMGLIASLMSDHALEFK
ncbi:hypothetical protein FGO68_gene1746 [Halteria grandinella]|uniref:Uncharacterized protein n=1 Tax=Halteria grandinella TaxID=5974 RepID=A0A8J8T854_HALGN|nr:hypothetical protein FGO68_gene1746 [Halteria grandinella]